MLGLLLTIKSFYHRFKDYSPIAFFFGGFTWDSLTLKRIDQLLDNLILLAYLLLLGSLILLVTFVENGRIKQRLVLKYRQWYPLALQFFLGGLFSAYVIFYFQSASFSRTFLFLGILLLLLIANEFLEKRLTNLYLLLSLYFMASFSFFIFAIPVLVKAVNVFTFIGGGLMSVLLVAGMIYLLHRKSILNDRRLVIKHAAPVLALYFLVNLFYWQNWIPPVPLSLKSGGIYHHASKDPASDAFILKFQQPKWYQPFKTSDGPFRYAPGDTVSCFTAVFAPSKLTERIHHHWQKYMPESGKWVTTDRLGYEITGFRDGGYRGITRKKNVSPGKWRVDVETSNRILLGRVNFRIENVQEPVPLKTALK